MTKLEELYDMAHEHNIVIVNEHFSDTKKAACIKSPNFEAVIMDKAAIETDSEEAILLGEELGHYKTASLYCVDEGYCIGASRVNRIKCEAAARRWAVKTLVPVSKLKRLINEGVVSYDELAGHFGVTPEFIQDALTVYTCKGVEFVVGESYGV